MGCGRSSGRRRITYFAFIRQACGVCGSIVWYFFKFKSTLYKRLKKTMTGKFQFRDLVYNINTKEDGAVRRVYETRGITMYEVAVPIQGDAWAPGHNISDWTEDVLKLSDNEHLKSCT